MDNKISLSAGRPKDSEKRKRILAAAKTVFLKSGYHGSSMNEIAKTAGVTKLTVYNHFQDKEKLFTCAIAQACEQSIQAQRFLLDTNSDFHQCFYQACQLTLSVLYLPGSIKLEHLLIELAAEKSPLVKQFFNASHCRMRLLWEDFFQSATTLEFLSDADYQQQATLILSLLLGLRHYEVLLGMRDLPTALEKLQIIENSMQIFLLKYPVKKLEC